MIWYDDKTVSLENSEIMIYSHHVIKGIEFCEVRNGHQNLSPRERQTDTRAAVLGDGGLLLSGSEGRVWAD